MGHAILLTGPPGCGKTTAIMRVLDCLTSKPSGFYTQEMLQGGGRSGFKLITLDGREGVLAHTSIRGRSRIGRYGVDLSVMDEIAVDAIKRGIDEGSLIVIDEIGPMELLSQRFKSMVLEALDSDQPVIGTIMRRSSPFADGIKQRPDVHLVRVARGKMDNVVEEIMGLLCEQGIA